MSSDAAARAARAERRADRRAEDERSGDALVDGDSEVNANARDGDGGQGGNAPDLASQVAALTRAVQQMQQSSANGAMHVDEILAVVAAQSQAMQALVSQRVAAPRDLDASRHDLRKAIISGLPQEHKLSSYKGVEGPIRWMKGIFTYIDNVLSVSPPLDQELEMRTISNFLQEAVRDSELSGFANRLIERNGRSIAQIHTYLSWDALREAIRAEIVTPERQIGIEIAIKNLTLTNYDVDKFERELDDLLAASDRRGEFVTAAKCEKLCSALTYNTLLKVQSEVMPRGKSILTCRDMKLLVEKIKLVAEQQKALGLPISPSQPQKHTPKPQEEKKTPQVAATTIEQPVESASAGSGAQRAGTRRRKSQERSTPGGSAPQGATTPRDPEAQARSNANFANRLMKFDKRFEGVSKEAVMRRIDTNVCPACGEKHRLAKCTSEAFVPSN